MQPSFDGRQDAPETPPTEGGTPAGAPRGNACVVLLAPGESAAPDELVRALEKRGLRPAGVGSCFHAMAALAAGAPFDEAEDGRTGRGAALIVVEPAFQPARRLDDLLASAAKFLPGAAVWSYAADATPRLRRLERPAPEPEIVVKGEAARHAAAAMRNGLRDPDSMGDEEPALRLRRAEDDGAPPPVMAAHEQDPDDADDPEQGLLSAEELSMLLADEDEEERQ